MKIIENIFGRKIKYLLDVTNIKNVTLAEYLGYDVSYVSKWISGKTVPSKKNLDETISKIIELICDDKKARPVEILFDEYQTRSMLQLNSLIKDDLVQAYYQSIGEVAQNNSSSNNNAQIIINPTNKQILMDKWKEEMDFSQPVDIMMTIDLFKLSHGIRLLFAGIEEGYFKLSKIRNDVKYYMNINLNADNLDIVYDTIFLIHMLTSYSYINFELFKKDDAVNRICYSLYNNYAVTGHLASNGQCQEISCTKNCKVVNDLYYQMHSEINPENKLFEHILLTEMLKQHLYTQSLLAPNISWLLGHITEHLIPERVFEEVEKNNEYVIQEMKRACSLLVNVYEESNVRIMIYESAIYNLVFSGEIDFFNNKVILSKKQRVDCLENIKQLVNKNNIQIFIIEEGFSNDFQYITNPCVFLSDTITYLRLENGIYQNNILKVRDKDLVKIFHQFYETIWKKRPDVVISDSDKILDKLNYYMNAVLLMPDIE